MEHINTVAITDFKIDSQSPNLAQVVISYTGKFNKETLRASLREKFDNRVAPVEDSFHEIKAKCVCRINKSFVRATARSAHRIS
jgi:hypothetical protein